MTDNEVTQAQLAQVLKVQQASVSRRLKGHSPWQLADLEVIAEAFSVTVVQLLGGIDPTGPNGGGLPRQDLNLRPSDYTGDASGLLDFGEASERRRNLRGTFRIPFPRKPIQYPIPHQAPLRKVA